MLSTSPVPDNPPELVRELCERFWNILHDRVARLRPTIKRGTNRWDEAVMAGSRGLFWCARKYRDGVGRFDKFAAPVIDRSLWTWADKEIRRMGFNGVPKGHCVRVMSLNLPITKFTGYSEDERSEWDGQELSGDLADPHTTPPEIDPDHPIWATLKQLGEVRAEAFVLHNLEELTIDEVAARLGIRKTTAANRVGGALIRLRVLMGVRSTVDPDWLKIGIACREKRKSIGWELKNLASAIGIKSTPTLSDMENGKRNPQRLQKFWSEFGQLPNSPDSNNFAPGGTTTP